LWPKADLVIGGPPCQGFSQLGARDPDDPRNNLWKEYLEVLDQSDAEFFVMENVPQLLKSPQFQMFLSEVKRPRRDFKIRAAVLSAADYGVPQIRNRAIVFGWRRGEPNLPAPSFGANSPRQRPYLTVRSALHGLPLEPDSQNWHRPRPNIRHTSLLRYAAVPIDGGNRFQMQARLDHDGMAHLVPQCWRRKTIGTTDVFGRLWWDRPAVTIRTEFYKPEKGRYLHPTADRPITIREAARLQSFPDSFRFPENQPMVSVARQIGNAVPPGMAKALAEQVKAHLSGDYAVEGAHAGQLELVAG
jgi:DNA (cytosine-5)-methyltransferase 1